MRSSLALITLIVVLLETSSGARQPSWKMSATVAESCSCTVSCPCNSGVQVLVTFNMRNWSKIYISDKVSDRQMKAIEAMLPLAFAGFHKGMLSFTKAPITMEATETRVKFSGPESSVEMAVMKGFNGTAIKVANLPSPVFQDYTQFKSVSHTHTSATHSWNHKGTNGFTSKWQAGNAK